MSKVRLVSYAVCVFSVVVIAVCVGIMLNRKPPEKPRPHADDWTHRELAAHLQTSGVPVHVRPLPSVGPSPVAAFYLQSRRSRPAGLSEEEHIRQQPRADVVMCPDHQAAVKWVADRGNDGFAWGKFAVTCGDHGFRERLLVALR